MESILSNAGITATICFKYDDVYFPYITLWYSSGNYHYQVFYDLESSKRLYNVLAERGKQVARYEWSTNSLRYILMNSR